MSGLNIYMAPSCVQYVCICERPFEPAASDVGWPHMMFERGYHPEIRPDGLKDDVSRERELGFGMRSGCEFSRCGL